MTSEQTRQHKKRKQEIGFRYSDNPSEYYRSYRQLEDSKKKARERAKRRRDMLSGDEGFRRDNARYAKEWREKNPERRVEWREKNKERLSKVQRIRSLATYGLTEDDFDRMMQDQGGMCGICRGPPNGRWKRLFVDHDHKTGKVRGLLCHLCNAALERVDNFRGEIDAYLKGDGRS